MATLKTITLEIAELEQLVKHLPLKSFPLYSIMYTVHRTGHVCVHTHTHTYHS